MTTLRQLLSFALAGVFVATAASSAFAQPQDKDQQKCINKLNKDGAKVAQAQGKENLGCLKSAGKNQLVGTAQACLTADAKQKVQKKLDKAVADDTGFCGTVPNYAYTGGAEVGTAAQTGELDLIADVFGSPLDAAVIDCATDKDGCLCQQKAMKAAEKIAAAKLKEFVKCKKNALKNGATSDEDIEDCVDEDSTAGSIAADSKGKIAKKQQKLEDDVAANCTGVSDPFPGACDSLTGTALSDCIDRQVECRVCQIINEMDALFVNCDEFDDGLANASCASGAGPPPTPTATPVPGVELQGALPPTNGRFTYQAIIGITGADAECNDEFAGTHACTYAELLVAEAAGDLDGLQDTNNTLVTSFWAIDATRPDDDQCTVSVPWDYATAHTGQFADAVTLNNGTGDLGALMMDTLCVSSRWVGCCL